MLIIQERVAQPNILILMEWYDHHIRKGIGRFAAEHNWHLTIDERTAIPKGWRGDGVLTVFNKRRDIENYVRKLNIPVVDMGLYRPAIPLPRVTGDGLRIGALAAEHFAERGYQHTAWFSRVTSPIERMRFQGFRETCLKLGLNEPCEWVWEKHAPTASNSWDALRQWLERHLLRIPEPLAVFTYNDYDASHVLDVCLHARISVPEQVAILGVDDNTLICLNQPVPLSSIIHDLPRIGYEAAALLNNLMHGAKPPLQPRLIPPRGLRLRQSTDYTAIETPAVRQALAFIRNHVHRSIGINEIAQHIGVSRSTLDRMFLEHFNRTTYQELHRARLNAVKELLIKTRLPLYKIAEHTGFCHAQHLHNLFKKHEGITPRVFRKRYQ